uniref:BRO1 domain-containing protein n=1 Tax=Parastrongyloides trichosuri TaxID=131310 RepID=A0A0N4ZM32_PARTI
MTHWFHRNPIKGSLHTKFELKKVLSNDAASKICSELRLRRDQLFDKFSDASNNVDSVEEDFKKYMQFLYGFIYEISPENNNSTGKMKDSKLRHLIKFTWTHTMLGTDAYCVSDIWYEVVSVAFNMALFYSKHAAYLSAKDDVNEIEAKKVHTCLRKAAGLFLFCQENNEKVIGTTGCDIQGCDLEDNVVEVYKQQCIGEAQEIVVARAIEMKHGAEIISSLCYNTANIFKNCDTLLEKMPKQTFDRWRHYFQIKNEIYIIYAYAYQGEMLLAQDKCGDAIKACKEGIVHYDKAAAICDKYPSAQGIGVAAKIKNHLFFRKMVPILKRHLEKAERENTMIYNQPVPNTAVPLNVNTEFGLAKPEPFKLSLDPEIWNENIYKAFDITKASTPDFSKLRKSTKQIPLIKEVILYQTEKDQSNRSGCVIS